MKFLYPSVRLTNQKPRAFVSVRQTNQIDLFPFVCSFCLFARFHCCRASAGSRPHSWSIWDFWFDGSMVPGFGRHLWLQRCAVSGLLSCRACLSLSTAAHWHSMAAGATRHFVLLSCKICAEIVVYRMLAVFLNGLNGKNSSRRIVRNIFSVYFF